MTSDERVEIAERLRKAHGIMKFVDALGIDLDSDWCWTDVSKRVAELIDPTCHVSDEEVMHQPTLNAMAVHVYTCDSCAPRSTWATSARTQSRSTARTAGRGW